MRRKIEKKQVTGTNENIFTSRRMPTRTQCLLVYRARELSRETEQLYNLKNKNSKKKKKHSLMRRHNFPQANNRPGIGFQPTDVQFPTSLKSGRSASL